MKYKLVYIEDGTRQILAIFTDEYIANLALAGILYSTKRKFGVVISYEIISCNETEEPKP